MPWARAHRESYTTTTNLPLSDTLTVALLALQYFSFNDSIGEDGEDGEDEGVSITLSPLPALSSLSPLNEKYWSLKSKKF